MENKFISKYSGKDIEDKLDNLETTNDVIGSIGNELERILSLRPVIKYVDLGLPSGLLWADRNLGANSPEEAGKYYAFGDIEGAYPDENGNFYNDRFYQYWYQSLGLYNGKILDENNILKKEYDAVYQSDNSARMPTMTEFNELINTNYVTKELIHNDNNEFVRVKITSKFNGNSIFLPITGYGYDGTVKSKTKGNFWSSYSYQNTIGEALMIDGNFIRTDSVYAHSGYNIRGVKPQN